MLIHIVLDLVQRVPHIKNLTLTPDLDLKVNKSPFPKTDD